MVQVMNLVERRLELSGVFVYGIVVHDRVVHHDGQAVDAGEFLVVFWQATNGGPLRVMARILGHSGVN
ncbi:hypothetical protein D3C71_1435970 [compost metagenome]